MVCCVGGVVMMSSQAEALSLNINVGSDGVNVSVQDDDCCHVGKKKYQKKNHKVVKRDNKRKERMARVNHKNVRRNRR